ncbi:MAG: S8 family peptidase [Arenicella sp.]
MKYRYLTLTLGAILFAPTIHAVDGSGWTVAIIDSGFNKNYTPGRVVRSNCFSRKTEVITDDRSTAGTTSKSYLFKHLSKCENDEASDSHSNSTHGKTLPRFKQNYYYYQNAGRVERKNFTSYYSQHGTNVFHQVLKPAPRVNLFPVTIGSFSIDESDSSYTDIHIKNCNPTLVSREYPISGRDYRITKFAAYSCSEYTTGDNILEGVNGVFNNSNKVVSANISLGYVATKLCAQQTAHDRFQLLINKGIIPVAASGNSSSLPIHWPACLNNVIAVAQVRNGIPVYSSVTGGKIDYFAEVTGNKPTDNQFLRGTSYAAPLVSGAFAAMKSANPNATVKQLKEVLHNTGTPVAGYTARVINVARAVQAIKNVPTDPTNPNPNPDPEPPTNPDPVTTIPPKPPTPLGQTARLGITDDTLYSHRDYPDDPDRAVRLAFTLNGGASAGSSEQKNELSVASASNPNISISDLRDIRLDFDGEFFSYADVRYVDGIDIWVNGVQRINFNSTQQAPSSNIHFKRHSFMLNRNWLQSGSNEIQIKPRKWSQIAWRVSRIRMDYNSPVPMVIGSSDTKLYGHRVGTRKHLTGMRVEFASVKSDVEFSVTGFDIDWNTEIAVFLNRRRIGYLTRGSSSQYNSGDTFLLEEESFVDSGINTIEFVQTSSSDRENWGVTNMELTGVKPPAIQGALMLLLSDVE